MMGIREDLKTHALKKMYAQNGRIAPCFEELLLPGYAADESVLQTAKLSEPVIRRIEMEPLDPFRVFATRMALANGLR